VESLNEHTIRVSKEIYKFEIKCATPEEAKLWLRRLQEEADESTLFHNEAIKQDLTPDQLDRYDFFENERQFVSDLTQIAEDLRELDRDERKKTAPSLMEKLHIPKTVYLPLCNSSDIWRRVSSTLSKETRVFNTKERCPVVMHFISKRGEFTKAGIKTDPNLDVAEYMHAYLEVKEDNETIEEGDETKEEEEPELVDDVEGERDAKSDDMDMRSSSHGSLANVWEEDEQGDGRKKLGNRVQQLLRDHVVPSRISKRLQASRRGSSRISIMDRQTAVQPLVPILEGSRGAQAAEDPDNASVGDGTVVSIERSSVLMKDHLVLGSLDEGKIDVESITKASKFICGGHLWAEKSAVMLEDAMKEVLGNSDNDMVQMEVVSCLSKSNDDLRQEVFIMQMIHYYKSVFAQAKLPLWLKTYRILSTSSSEGLIELLTDATSLDGLKKSEGYPTEGGLRAYFENVYGGPNSKAFKAAQTNFMQSLAGYALVSYLLGLKDRHNGNIMIDTRGHLVFIDFGFALGMAPGHEFSFERAPFKLTKEYVEVMGGVNSDCYKEFERLFVAGFEEARKNYQIALGLVEIMMFQSNYPCFSGWRYGGGKALARFEKRLMLDVPEKQVKRRALKLIRRSKQHFGTYLYDAFQKATNGYAI
jgi:phosphatidylinositol 4-kinase